jgi:hypothetical protein
MGWLDYVRIPAMFAVLTLWCRRLLRTPGQRTAVFQG